MRMARIKNSIHLVALLLVFVAVTNASIKWRRVTKTTPASIHITTTGKIPSVTKTPVTWRRSTLSRRSTTEQEVPEHEEEHEEKHEEELEKEPEVEDIDVADSREDVSVLEEDTEAEPAIKPLVPGSRPGFWFDSSRKRKPSALLRPGSRKSSLFPSKLSTLTVPNSTTESPPTILPVTTPRSIHSPRLNNTSSSKFKTLGRNSSTKPPVAFKRRLKTTKSPRTTTTTKAPEIEESESDEQLPRETEDFNVKEKDLVSTSKDQTPQENTKGKPYESARLPGIRRRKNDTRTSWRKEGNRFSPSTASSPSPKISRTTPIPDIKTSRTAPTTITTSTRAFSRTTRKPTSASRIRSRTKLNRTTSLPHRTRTKSTPAPTSASISSTQNFDKKPSNVIKGPTNYLRNRNVHKFNRLKPKPIPEESVEEEINLQQSTTPEFTTLEPKEDFDNIVNYTQEFDIHSISTLEPFYITRDYGELVTAIPEIGRKKGRVPQRSTTSLPVTVKHEEIIEFEKLKNLEVNNTKNDASREEEVYEDNNLKFSTVDETFKYPDNASESISRPSTPRQQPTKHSTPRQQLTTTKPPVTMAPFSHTIDPGNNAYVVWSLGQGGSGWSYEKQGGQVKWSAQNSQVEGDRWSVQGTELKGTSNSAVWTPANSTSTLNNRKSESRTTQTETDKQVYYPNDKSGFDNTNYWTPVTYMPKIPYRNETILQFTTPGDVKKLPPSVVKDYSPFPPGIRDFSPIVYQNAGNNILSENFNSVHSLDKPELNINTDFQNSKTDGSFTINQTVSLSSPYESENVVTFKENSNIFEPINVSYVDEYLTQPPQDSINWNLPTTITTPEEEFHGQDFENQFSKSTYPSFQAEDVTPFRITVPDSGFIDNIPSTVSSAYFNGGFSEQARDLSGIPPALAKAVIDAKRWTVVGTGGSEGWSLLGENGQLEWKIHNIDGKWSVTSGDKLLKLPLKVPSPSQETSHDEDNQTGNLEIENVKEKPTLSSPKIWKLEDDYNKWKVLSAEAGIQVESAEDKLTPNREYDYDRNVDLEEDYYDNEDEQEYDELGGNSFTPPSFYEAFDDRPLWGTGENEMIQRYPGSKGEYSTPFFPEGIESANTKEDAIEAWKSLLVDQGNWKVSKENYRENPQTTVSSKYSITSPSKVNSEWKAYSTTTLKPRKNFEKVHFEEYPPIDRSTGKNEEVQENKVYQDGIYYNQNPALKNIDVEDFEGNEENEKKSLRPEHSKFRQKDHAKIDTLINKLENIQKGSKGRAVVDLSQLLKLIKTNRNSTSGTPNLKGNQGGKNQARETDNIPYINKTIEYQKVRHQEDSSRQRQQENDSTSSEIQYDNQQSTHERYTNKLKKNFINPEEQFPKVAKQEEENTVSKINLPSDSILREYEQISREQIEPVRKFDKDRIYFKQLENIGHRDVDDIPTRIHNRQNYETSEEDERKFQLKNKNERVHIKDNEHSENNEKYPYSSVNVKHTHSNFEKYPDKQRTPVQKNHDNEKYVSDVDSSSEEFKTRRKIPHDLPNNRGKPEVDTHRRIYKYGSDTGDHNEYLDKGRLVTINKPKRKHGEFQISPANPPLIDELNIKSETKLPENNFQNVKESTSYSNRDSSEKYTISNKHHTPKNRRKRPQTMKTRLRGRGRPGHSKVSGNARTSHYSSAEKISSNHVKRPQEIERYEQNSRPEVNEEIIRPVRHEEGRRPQRNEENRFPQRNEENRFPQTDEENRRPQRTEENRRPQRTEKNRRPQRKEEIRRPERYLKNRRPERYEEKRNLKKYEEGRSSEINDESTHLERYEERRHLERYDEKVHPERYEDYGHEENIYDSSPEFTTMRQKQKVRSNKYSQASPVVISSETEIEDDEDGSKKNRKIIVIDYAGRQKKKSPIDRKDLELIIRSVKNRRSEVMEDASSENYHIESEKEQ